MGFRPFQTACERVLVPLLYICEYILHIESGENIIIYFIFLLLLIKRNSSYQYSSPFNCYCTLCQFSDMNNNTHTGFFFYECIRHLRIKHGFNVTATFVRIENQSFNFKFLNFRMRCSVIFDFFFKAINIY